MRQRLLLARVLLRSMLHALKGSWLMWRRFPTATQAEKNALSKQWARDCLRIFNVELEVQGEPQVEGPLLVVSNHISWLDILVLLAVQPVNFISRIENAKWPVLGYLIRGSGTIFVARESKRDTARVVAQIAQYLKAQRGMVAFFPEGRTSAGKGVAHFHGNMLQAAIDSAVPVQALALDYRLATPEQARSSAVSYADINFVQSVLNTLASGPYIARVYCAAPVESRDWQRRELAAQLRSTIMQMRGDIDSSEDD